MPAELFFDEAAHRYTVNGRTIPSVTQIISAVGLYEFDFVSRETLRIAAERGRIVHTYIEWYERGVLDFDSLDPELEGYLRSYILCKRHHSIPDPDQIEQRVYSDRYGYAGTLDQRFGDWINDHKTGSRDPVHGIQLSAYWLAEHPNLNEKPERLTCGYYSNNGQFELVDYPYEPLVWLSILAEYKWRVKHNKIKEIWK